MTIASTTTKVSFSGNASTTVFAYSFKIFATTDLEVIIRSSTGVETVKTLTTHYSVSGAGDDSGGNVTFGSAPASGETIVIRRKVPLTQGTDYVENDPFPAETHEAALDRLTIISQQQQEEVGRSLKFPTTDLASLASVLPASATRANTVLAFDVNGEVVTTTALGTWKGNWATSTAYVIRDLVKDTSNANVYIANTAHTSTGSQPLSSNADAAKWDLVVDAAAAATSAAAALVSEIGAAADVVLTNADVVLTHADVVLTHADVVLTHADVVLTNADVVSAAASATAAATSYDNFDDRYLGQKSSDPSVDNDGSALLTGAMYFNTSNNVMMVYTGSAWVRTTPTSSDQTAINTVNANATNINTTAGIAANVTTVAGIAGNVTSVAGNATNINKVATVDANVTKVADIDSDVTTVANIDSDVAAVENIAANVTTVAGVAANVTTVAGVSANVTTVAGISANTTTVAGIAANVTTTAGIAGDVTTVAGISGDVSAVAAQVVGYDFSTTTTMSDPGSGNVRFNHASIASVSAIAIDDLDKNGVDQSAFITLWDDSTNTVKGTLVFRTGGGDVATFSITGLTDNAGWSQIAVTHVASSGTFATGEDTFIGFARAGDKGTDGVGAGTVTQINAGDGFSFSAITGTGTIAVDGVLQDLDALGAPSSDGQFIVATGSGAFNYESGTTARESLGAVGIGLTLALGG